jgi:hypothetical protein
MTKILIQFVNVLGGLDEALHGSDHLQGWGAASAPDPILYTVRGFDASTNSYQYSVNPRFGNTRSSQTTLRAPFRVSLDVQIELGRPVRSKQFDQFRDITPLGPKHGLAPIDTLTDRLSNVVGDFYGGMIFRRDSLLLTRGQVEALQAADTIYKAKANAIWREVAVYAATIEPNGGLQELIRRKDAAAGRVWALERLEIPRMLQGLTPAQRELAVLMLAPLADSEKHRPSSPVLF